MSLTDRLIEAFDPARHTPGALAAAARVTGPSISQWFSGKTKSLKAEPAIRAARYLGVDELWLAAGEGPKYRGEAMVPAPSPPPSLPEALEVLGLHLAQDMPEDAREDVADALAKLAKRHGAARDQELISVLLKQARQTMTERRKQA